MSDSKKCCFVIDCNSIKYSKSEAKEFDQLQIYSQIQTLKNQNNSLKVDYIETTLELIVTKIQNQCNKEEVIILYLHSKNTYSSKLNFMIENNPVLKSVKLLTGPSSLFLFIGCNLNDFSSVCCLSKEKQFIPENLKETISTLKNNCQWKVFCPLRYDMAIRHYLNYY